jgi:hypothetical protein
VPDSGKVKGPTRILATASSIAVGAPAHAWHSVANQARLQLLHHCVQQLINKAAVVKSAGVIEGLQRSLVAQCIVHICSYD